MKKINKGTCCLFFILVSYINICLSQNTIVGDSFGGRLWYKPTNLSSYSYGGFITCGPEKKLYGWGYSHTSLIIKNQIYPIYTPQPVYNLSNVKYHSGGYYAGVIKTNDSGFVWSESKNPVGVISDVFFCDAAISSVAFIKKDYSLWLTYGPASALDVRMVQGINKIKRVAICSNSNNFFTLNSDGYVDFVNVVISGSNYKIIKKNRLNIKSILDIQSTSSHGAALDKNGNVSIFDYSMENPDSTTYMAKVNLPYPAVAISGKCDGSEFLYLFENGYCYKSNNSGNNGLNGFVFIDSNVIDIDAGEGHHYYVTSDKKMKQIQYSGNYMVSIDSSCIEAQTMSFKTRTLCKGDSVSVNGKYYTKDGLYKLDSITSYLTIITKDTFYYYSKSIKCNDIVNPTERTLLNKTEDNKMCIKYFVDTIYKLKYSDTVKLNSCAHSALYKGEIYKKDTEIIERYQTISGCDSNINIFIHFYSPNIQFIDKIFIKCFDEEFTYQNIIFKTAGIYQDTLRNKYGCDSVIRKFTFIDSNCLRIYIPDAFTPNKEGPITNNTFQPRVLNCDYFRMEIFNRWGEKLFETTDANAGWDGNYLGKMSPNGVYVYKISVKSKENKLTQHNGTFTLIR